MADELNLNLSFDFDKNGSHLGRSLSGLVTCIGNAIQYATPSIGASDQEVDTSYVTASNDIGYIFLHNLNALVVVTQAGAPTVANQGTPGAATWSYKVVARQSSDPDIYANASAAGTTTTGNATLTGVNFNRLTWAAIPGAESYDIYRTAHGTTPSTNGLIGNTTELTFDDTGLAGDSTTAPTTAIDNFLFIGSISGTYPLKLKGGEFALLRWNAGAIHAKANTADVQLEYAVFPAD